MRKLVPLLAVALVAAGIALAYLLGGGDRPESTQPGAPASPTQSPHEDERPSAALAEPPAHQEAGSGASDGDEGRILAEAGTAPVGFTAAPESGVEVHVVRQADRSPVARATVFYLNPSRLAEEVQLELLTGDLALHSLFERFATRYRADDRGVLRVPFGQGAMVAAQAAGLWGHAEVRTDDPLVVELEPDLTLAVDVVGVDGRSVAGVPVVLRAIGGGGSPYDLVRLLSDADGRATFRHLKMLLEEPVGRGQTPRVALGLPVEQPAQLDLDFADLPAEPVVLAMPATGALVIELITPAGKPYLEEGYLTLELAAADDDQGSLRFGYAGQYAPLEEGRARYPFVEPGRRFKVQASFSNGRDAVQTLTNGPVRAGETETVRLQIRDDVPFVSARLLDAKGEPLAERRLQTTLETRSGSMSRSMGKSARTDEEGRFELVIEAPFEEGSRKLRIATSEEEPIVTRVDLSYHLAAGENALGDLVLEPPPLVAEGLVVDDLGLPVAGARLTVESGQQVHPEVDRWSWHSVRDLRINSDENGRFQLRGWVPEGRLALQATHPDYIAPERLEFAPGSRQLAITMPGAGTLRGKLQLDEGVEPRDVSLRLIDVRTQEPPKSARRTLKDGGAFELTRVPAGTYDLHVQLSDSDEPLLVIDQLLAVPGEVNDDPRLNPIDLRGMFQAIRLRVTDADGATIPQLKISYRPTGDDEAPWRFDWQRDEQTVSIVTTAQAIDIEVASEGYRTARLDGVVGEREVVLLAGAPLRFVLSGGLPALPPNVHLEVAVTPAGPDSSRFSGGNAKFDASGTAEIRASGGGTFRIALHIVRIEGRMARSYGVRCTPDRVDVQVEGEQTFLIEVETKLFEEGLRRLLEER
ncbi:MAG: hypothetical protein AAF682_10475 [Planctomycetota bacterium]